MAVYICVCEDIGLNIVCNCGLWVILYNRASESVSQRLSDFFAERWAKRKYGECHISNYRLNEKNETFDEATNSAVESVQGIVSVEAEQKCWRIFNPPSLPSSFFLSFFLPPSLTFFISLLRPISLQFECCGVTNYSDWIRLNPDAVEMNNDFIPARCYCDIDEENCLNDEKYNTTNVWDRVRE